MASVSPLMTPGTVRMPPHPTSRPTPLMLMPRLAFRVSATLVSISPLRRMLLASKLAGTAPKLASLLKLITPLLLTRVPPL